MNDSRRAGPRLILVPITITDAKRFVARLHRHNDPPVSALFAVAAACDDTVVAVAIVGRPIARRLDNGWTAEVTRVAADGTPNACSKLYSAAARAAGALGYTSAITYTLAEEPGTSLIASGWEREADVPAAATWDCPSRRRAQKTLWGDDRRPPGAKVRWRKWLVPFHSRSQTPLRGVECRAEPRTTD